VMYKLIPPTIQTLESRQIETKVPLISGNPQPV